MSTTELPLGGKPYDWEVDAPDGVTVTPKTNADGVVTSLDIAIDYTQADLHDPQSASMLPIHFQGPEPDPQGTAKPGDSYPGLALPTTIEVKNDTGGDIHGFTFFVADDDSTLPKHEPQDFSAPHPNDYAHFHNLTRTSLVDQNGTPNAIITLQDPSGHGGAFGPPGAEKPLAAPAWINSDGTIKAGAIEKLIGLANNGGVTLHSEDKPGEFGGSFTLYFYPYEVDPATIDTHEIERQQLLDSLHNPDLLPPIRVADMSPLMGPGPGDPMASSQPQVVSPDPAILSIMPNI